MGFSLKKFVKKTVKKVTSSIKKVVKHVPLVGGILEKAVDGISKVHNKVFDAAYSIHKKVHGAVKKFAKSKVGKLVVMAAAIYFTGGLMAGAFAPGAVFGSAGLGSMWASSTTLMTKLAAANSVYAASQSVRAAEKGDVLGAAIAAGGAVVGAKGVNAATGGAAGSIGSEAATEASKQVAANAGQEAAKQVATEAGQQAAQQVATDVGQQAAQQVAAKEAGKGWLSKSVDFLKSDGGAALIKVGGNMLQSATAPTVGEQTTEALHAVQGANNVGGMNTDALGVELLNGPRVNVGSRPQSYRPPMVRPHVPYAYIPSENIAPTGGYLSQAVNHAAPVNPGLYGRYNPYSGA